jgi:UDP:flavonoid glycosyltransferase YjiC (YdhE family)
MRITLAPVGTASDVFPMLALAKALHARDHLVTLCAAEEFRSVIYKSGFQLFSNGKSYRNYLEGEGTADDSTTELATLIGKDLPMHFVALRDATRHAEVLVGSRLQIAGPSMAEQLKIPYLYFTASPGTFDYDLYPIFGVSQERVQKRRSRRVKDWDEFVLSSLNQERKLSHLPPVKNLFEYLYRSGPMITAVDPAVAPMKDSANVNVTGFCLFEDVFDVDENLTAFLNEGPAPIYLAPFRTKDDHQVNAICEALVHVGHRVVVGYGWQKPSVPAGCLVSSSVSYAQIFPHMSTIIHGGVSDIVAQAIQTRVPQVIVPFTAEQSYWAQIVSAIGAGIIAGSESGEILSALEQALKTSAKVKEIQLSIPNGAEAAALIIEQAAQKQPEE